MKPILDFGFVQIPTFYLILSLSVTFLLFLLNAQLDKHPTYNKQIAFDIAILILVFGFIGGRLAHVVYEEPQFYFKYPFEILKFWKGGYVFFGGFISSLVAVTVFLKKKNESFYLWADFFTPFIAIGYAFGRLGCFFEGCCYGSSCALPWAVVGRHPTQIYMLLSELFLIALLLIWKNYASLKHSIPSGLFFLLWLCGHATNRFLIEFLRDDDRGALIASLSISQWISLIIFMTSLMLLNRLFNLRRN